MLGQWDILLLNLTSIGFTNFLDDSSFFFFTNADVVTIKDETSTKKKIREPNAGPIGLHLFHGRKEDVIKT